MNMTRRDFVGCMAMGAVSLGTARYVQGAASDFGPDDLKLGILSDTHVSLEPGAKGSVTAQRLRKELEWFRDQHVDGVLVSGDLTNTGLQDEFELFAGVWNSVFPNGKLPDGSPVANLCHYGDHDAEVRFYRKDVLGARYAKAGLPLPASLAEGELRKTLWEKYFHEEWSPIVHKRVRGYDFVLAHFLRECPGTTQGLDEFMKKLNPDPSQPFFYSQHRWIKGTYMADDGMWGVDSGKNGPALARYPNVLAFCGHTHYMLMDERNLWQDGYTVLGTGSLLNQCVARLRENGTEIPWYSDEKEPTRFTQMQKVNGGQAHAGMLMHLRGNQFVVERRDMERGLPLGPDLLFSISAEVLASRMYTNAARTARSVAPEFPEGATVAVAKRKGKNRRRETVDQIVITFPVAHSTATTPRAYDYVVTAETQEGGCWRVLRDKRVYSPKVNCPESVDVGPVACVFAMDELQGVPVNKVRFKIQPMNSWRVGGKVLCYTGRIS